MAKATTGGWLRGRVKAVLSGDTLVVMAVAKADEIPPEKTIVLAHLYTPRLAKDELFAWESREFLRSLCIGKDVVFRTEYTIPNTSRECCSVFIDSTNIAKEVVKHGWAKVRRHVTPELAELLRLEKEARQEGKGLWNKSPDAIAAANWEIPPSAVDNPDFDAMGFFEANKGTNMEAIVEHVRDGSCLYAYLFPESRFVKVFVAGIQAPSMRRATDHESTTSSASTDNEVFPAPYGRGAKHFTEMRVLCRDVSIVLKGVDKQSNNFVGSVVYYPDDGEEEKDLALELVENGFAKYVNWSAEMMEKEARMKLKAAELEAKKNKLRMWTNYVLPSVKPKEISNNFTAANPKEISNNFTAASPKAISNSFTGKVIEVVSGDCIIVANDSVPFGSLAAERKVNLSSIRCPKMGNPKPDPYAREARELLRRRLIGRQVQVSMEYSRRVPTASNGSTDPNGTTETQVMDFGSVFLLSQGKDSSEDVSSAGGQQPGVNVARLIISRGFGTVIKQTDSKERSEYYEDLLAEESGAKARGKGIHSFKDPPVMHVTDLTTVSPKKAKEFLPCLKRNRRMPAVVEYVLKSGHRFKLYVPKEACSITFSLSGVRCPGRKEPYSDEAISLMRWKLMQRDVEIEVETVDRNGTFLGSLWESGTNAGVTLLEAGLARLETTDKITDANLLAQAEQLAREQELKIWGKQVEETQ